MGPRRRDDFVPPTYDLRELGRGLEVYARLDRMTDRMLAAALDEVGCAFARVPAFATRARTEAGREDERFRATTRERYLVELLACVVMGRQLWPEFVARRDTVLILPDCLSRRGDACEARSSRYGRRCAVCDETCTVGRITVTAARYGAGAFFSDREHERQFQALQRGRYRDLSVIGVACVWMLANGMRAAEEAGVPSQGVLLEYCGCEHWRDDPVVTAAAVERVEQILRDKAEARREAPGAGPPG